MIDYWYLVLVLPAFLLTLIAQMSVKSTFNKYNKVLARNGMSGAQAARAILDASGLQHIQVAHIRGNLNDHYSPKENIIRLSDATYTSNSIAAVGVAAHEAGHAVQYAKEYGPIRARTALVPVTNIGAQLAWPSLLLGMLLSMQIFITIGIVLFSLAVVFQVVTLPVEFNASNRALEILDQYGMLSADEQAGAKKVLRAAAMTYVASLALSIMQLIRLLLIFGGGRRKR